MIQYLLVVMMCMTVTCYGAQKNGTNLGMKKSQSEPSLTRIETPDHPLSLSASDSSWIPVHKKFKTLSPGKRKKSISTQGQRLQEFRNKLSLNATIPVIENNFMTFNDDDTENMLHQNVQSKPEVIIPAVAEVKKKNKTSPVKEIELDDLSDDEDDEVVLPLPIKTLEKRRNTSVSLETKIAIFCASSMALGLVIYKYISLNQKTTRK